MKQENDEPIIKYLHRLRNASIYCEFAKLVQEEDDSRGLNSIKVNWRYVQCITPMENNGTITNKKYVFKYVHWLCTATRVNTKIKPL